MFFYAQETSGWFSLCHSLRNFCSPVKGCYACFHFFFWLLKTELKKTPKKQNCYELLCLSLRVGVCVIFPWVNIYKWDGQIYGRCCMLRFLGKHCFSILCDILCLQECVRFLPEPPYTYLYLVWSVFFFRCLFIYFFDTVPLQIFSSF